MISQAKHISPLPEQCIIRKASNEVKRPRFTFKNVFSTDLLYIALACIECFHWVIYFKTNNIFKCSPCLHRIFALSILTTCSKLCQLNAISNQTNSCIVKVKQKIFLKRTYDHNIWDLFYSCKHFRYNLSDGIVRVMSIKLTLSGQGLVYYRWWSKGDPDPETYFSKKLKWIKSKWENIPSICDWKWHFFFWWFLSTNILNIVCLFIYLFIYLKLQRWHYP